MCPLEKGMANHFSILALRAYEQYEKKKDGTLKDELPRLVGAQKAPEISGELTPERMDTATTENSVESP